MQVTHPRILFLLAFLVSSASKRDAVGRKPKRKVFATEGLTTWDSEAARELSCTFMLQSGACNVSPYAAVSVWARMEDVQEVEERLARIKGDLLCEVIAVRRLSLAHMLPSHLGCVGLYYA